MSLSTLEVFKHIQPEGAVVLTDEQLLDLQKTLNGILRDIISVCAKHHLRYFLGGGSALGAIRHHGFIPWDDDIDINMPREDHDRFVQVFRQEFGTKYWVHTPEETAGYGLLLSRVLLKGTSVRTREDFHNPSSSRTLTTTRSSGISTASAAWLSVLRSRAGSFSVTEKS